MKNLIELFDELDKQTEKEVIIKSPFGYPGGKSRSVSNITKYLPYTERYVEPFGGSGIVLLSRHSSKLEVLNDRYAGVVAFYRCLRNPKQYEKLIEWLELTIHSREEFLDCRDHWIDCYDDVERAAKWYYMINYSFTSLGRHFGRTINAQGRLAGKIRNKLKYFPDLHERLKFVQIENQDWRDCINDYDHTDTVFYIDPPYIDASPGIFKESLTKNDHRDLLETIFDCKGFVALSGYENPFYDSFDWDNKHSWESFVSADSLGIKGNFKEHIPGTKKICVEEVLWIKEARS